MWQQISNIGAVLGIVGVSANSILGSAREAHIALGVIAITCIVVIAYVYWRVRRWQQTIYPKGFRPIATFIRYTTTDGKLIMHETFRHIQIKHTFLTQIEHRFRWTGTHEPEMSSELQTLGPVTHDEATDFKVRCVKFERPRFYNDAEVVHLQSKLDDSDEKSQTFVSVLIDTPITIVQFRVELLHCQHQQFAGMHAYVERKRKTINAPQFELVGTVAFELMSRSFAYLLKHPEPGYEYRMRWDRPQLPQAKRRNGGK